MTQHKAGCAALTMLMSDPPQRGQCDCGANPQWGKYQAAYEAAMDHAVMSAEILRKIRAERGYPSLEPGNIKVAEGAGSSALGDKVWCGNPKNPLACAAHNNLCKFYACSNFAEDRQQHLNHLIKQSQEAVGTLTQLLGYIKSGYADGYSTMNSQCVQHFVETAIKELEKLREPRVYVNPQV